MFHCDPLKHFDTLSVYRGFVVDQVARARTVRSETCNDSANMKNRRIQKFKSRAIENIETRPIPETERFNASTLQRLPACQAQ